MYAMKIIGLLLVIAGGCCAARTYRIHLELKRLLPSQLARRWLASLPRRPGTMADQFQLHALKVLPVHWWQDLHAERGAALVRQLYLFLALAWGLAAMGFTLLGGIVASAV